MDFKSSTYNSDISEIVNSGGVSQVMIEGHVTKIYYPKLSNVIRTAPSFKSLPYTLGSLFTSFNFTARPSVQKCL